MLLRQKLKRSHRWLCRNRGDHSGWQLRLTDGEIHRVLIALEINEPVIDEAIAVRAEVILTHHPLLFSPLREVDCNTVIGNQMIKLIQNRISVYATHTPFDKWHRRQ